jgi:aerobic-type carbon monoxide dehydrogenase small subunit (CoxS/CutS family)
MRGGPLERTPRTSISLTINARLVVVATHGDTPLLDVLCNHLGLTCTRFSCGLEQSDAGLAWC